MADDRGKAFAALRAGQPVSDAAVFYDVGVAIKLPVDAVRDAPPLPAHILEKLDPGERLSYLRLVQKKGGR